MMEQNTISDYMRAIGRKGGQAGKGSPRRIESNRRTTLNRMLRQIPRPKKVKDSLEMIEHSG